MTTRFEKWPLPKGWPIAEGRIERPAPEAKGIRGAFEDDDYRFVNYDKPWKTMDCSSCGKEYAADGLCPICCIPLCIGCAEGHRHQKPKKTLLVFLRIRRSIGRRLLKISQRWAWQ